jgi:hypothetical protein
MPKLSATIHTEFVNRLNVLNSTRISFETAFTAGNISDSEIIQGYAGLYLDIFTEFEAILENLFIGILSGRVSHSDITVIRKIRIKPVTEIENVMQGEKRSYLDWLPYKESTLNRANLYFQGGLPFSKLNQNQKGKIKTFHKIRNAIAHKGKKAMDDFNLIIAGLALLPVERTPSGYLRNIPNPVTGLTQLEIIATELTAISNSLCN